MVDSVFCLSCIVAEGNSLCCWPLKEKKKLFSIRQTKRFQKAFFLSMFLWSLMIIQRHNFTEGFRMITDLNKTAESVREYELQKSWSCHISAYTNADSCFAFFTRCLIFGIIKSLWTANFTLVHQYSRSLFSSSTDFKWSALLVNVLIYGSVLSEVFHECKCAANLSLVSFLK